jgi:hypothetical protein
MDPTLVIVSGLVYSSVLVPGRSLWFVGVVVFDVAH